MVVGKMGLTVRRVGLVRVLYRIGAVWTCGRASALTVLDGQTMQSGVELWNLECCHDASTTMLPILEVPPLRVLQELDFKDPSFVLRLCLVF